MIDTHCHLNLDPLYGDVKGVIERAEQSGVTSIIVPGVDVETSSRGVEVSRQYENIYAAVGIHPHEEGGESTAGIQKLLKENTSIVAVGEVGLDFSHPDYNYQFQVEQFLSQIALAKEFALPLIVHSRDAYTETATLLQQAGYMNAVIHCFTGTYEQAKAFLDIGCMLSLTGIITYRSSAVLREMVSKLPLKCLMIETDSPYLAPQTRRGKSNQPAFLPEVAEVLSLILSISTEEVDLVTTKNAQDFFQLNKHRTI